MKIDILKFEVPGHLKSPFNFKGIDIERTLKDKILEAFDSDKKEIILSFTDNNIRELFENWIGFISKTNNSKKVGFYNGTLTISYVSGTYELSRIRPIAMSRENIFADNFRYYIRLKYSYISMKDISQEHTKKEEDEL